MLENSSWPLTSGRLLSQVHVCLIALSTPRSRIWLYPIVGCTTWSLDWWLFREQVLDLVCKSNGLLLTIDGSFALWWWIVLYTDTLKSLSCFSPFMLFSWRSCWFLHQIISLGSSSNRSFLQKTAAFVPLSGEALGVCSTVCASSVRESHVQPVKFMSAGGAGLQGGAWSPSPSAMP